VDLSGALAGGSAIAGYIAFYADRVERMERMEQMEQSSGIK